MATNPLFILTILLAVAVVVISPSCADRLDQPIFSRASSPGASRRSRLSAIAGRQMYLHSFSSESLASGATVVLACRLKPSDCTQLLPLGLIASAPLPNSTRCGFPASLPSERWPSMALRNSAARAGSRSASVSVGFSVGSGRRRTGVRCGAGRPSRGDNVPCRHSTTRFPCKHTPLAFWAAAVGRTLGPWQRLRRFPAA